MAAWRRSMLLAVGKKVWSVYKRLRIAFLGSQPSWRRVSAGFEMRIDPADWPDRDMFFGVYEPALRELIRRVMRPGEGGVDIGTHKGYFTLLMAQTVGPTGRVWAADPDPRTFAAMQANCERNGFAQVRRFQVAVANAAGTCEIALNSQLGWTSRFPNQLAQDRIVEKIEVETRSVDDLVDADEGLSLSLIKIDAEGSETLILKGMDRTVQRFRPLLYMEVTPDSFRAAGTSGAELQAILNAWGYRALEVVWSRNAIGRGIVRLRPVDLSAKTLPDMNVVCSDPGVPLHRRIASLIHS